MKIYTKILLSLGGISLAEFIAWLPSVDEFTAILKLMIQLILLIVALLQGLEVWEKRKEKN